MCGVIGAIIVVAAGTLLARRKQGGEQVQVEAEHPKS